MPNYVEFDTVEGSANEAKQLVTDASIPGHCGWFGVGLREAARVTLYTQQVRALNLAWALKTVGEIRSGTRAVVVGGGAAGLTVAAALAHLEAHVTVLEKEADVLPLQRNCYKRHLHPRIYDWPLPESKQASARLPLLTWRAGMARDVAFAIESGFEELAYQHGDRLRLKCGVTNLQLDVPEVGAVTFRTATPLPACAGPSRSHKTAHRDHPFRAIAITQNGASRSPVSRHRDHRILSG
jgi:NADPH-dependent 2,4-dienoyl-CoA reductase/sulfur reductase-like enzyme